MKSESAKSRTEKRYSRLARILGSSARKSKIDNSFDFIAIAQRGVKADAIHNFRTHFNIPRDKAATFLNVSEPTIYRWVRDNRTMDRNHAVQLMELTDLFLFGIDAFGSAESFFSWLELPNQALGGMMPEELLEIPGGIARVRELIGRIEYGVYS